MKENETEKLSLSTDVEKESSKQNNKDIVVKGLLGIETDKSIDKRKRIFKNILSIVFILFVVVVLVITAIDDFSGGQLVTFDELSATLSENWFYIIFAFVSIAVFFLAKGFLRAVVCRSITGKAHLKTCIEAGVVCQFYNYITPLAVGGQPFEVSYFSKHGVHGGHAAAVPISTYLVNMFSGLILDIVAIIIYKNQGFLADTGVFAYFPTTIYVLAWIGISFNLILPILVLLFSLWPKLGSKLVYLVVFVGRKLKIIKNPSLFTYKTLHSVLVNAKAIKNLVKKPFTLILSFLFGFLEGIAFASIAYFVLRFYGFNWPAKGFIEWMQIVILSRLIFVAIAVFPTPGNSGAADLSFYSLFANVLAPGLAFPAMLTWRFIIFYLVIIVGLIFTRAKARLDKKKFE